MARLPLTYWAELQAPGPIQTRGTPRLVPDALTSPSRSGSARDRNAACLDALGLSFTALCTLTALVARARAGHTITTRATIGELLEAEEGFTVSGGLRELERLRLAREIGRLGCAGAWEATEAGMRKALAWSGMLDERRSEAAE